MNHSAGQDLWGLFGIRLRWKPQEPLPLSADIVPKYLRRIGESPKRGAGSDSETDPCDAPSYLDQRMPTTHDASRRSDVESDHDGPR